MSVHVQCVLGVSWWCVEYQQQKRWGVERLLKLFQLSALCLVLSGLLYKKLSTPFPCHLPPCGCIVGCLSVCLQQCCTVLVIRRLLSYPNTLLLSTFAPTCPPTSLTIHSARSVPWTRSATTHVPLSSPSTRHVASALQASPRETTTVSRKHSTTGSVSTNAYVWRLLLLLLLVLLLPLPGSHSATTLPCVLCADGSLTVLKAQVESWQIGAGTGTATVLRDCND